jgi:hypothetical protein
MHTIYRSVTQFRTAVFCALAAMTIAGNVQAKPNIDGAWKLSKPQVLLTPANGEPIPFTAAGKKIYEQNKTSAQQGKYGFDEVMDRCASPGAPRIMMSPNQFKVFDRPGMVMFKFEWNRLYRQVDMRDDAAIENSKPLPRKGGMMFPGAPGGLPPGGPPGAGGPGGGAGGPPGGGPPGAGGPGGAAGGAPGGDPFGDTEALLGTQMGHARGRWEGDVLVVETNELTDYKLIDGLIQTSDELKLSEHFRLKDKNTLENLITITDPVTFTKPWDAVLTYKRQPNETMAEDVCIERKHAGESPWPKPL